METNRLEALRNIRKYLAHPDVQKIPFALPASNPLRVLDAIIEDEQKNVRASAEVPAMIEEVLKKLIEADDKETADLEAARNGKECDQAKLRLSDTANKLAEAARAILARIEG